MSENKSFVLKKTTPNDLIFRIRPISNQGVDRLIHLTKLHPQIALPVDWALGVFFDEGVLSLYKQGYFTFNDNKGLVAAAVEAGVYFSDELDFEPAPENSVETILATLKAGNRANIKSCMEKFGVDKVKSVAIQNADALTQGVVNMLESLLNINLTLNMD